MTLTDRDQLRAQLVRHEAERLKPYMDCCGKPWRLCACRPQGKLTIGIGRNLDDVGISRAESGYLNSNDVDESVRGLVARYPTWFPDLDPVRQCVLVNMAFNLGLSRLASFRQMLHYAALGDFEKAADEMLASDWAQQTGHRAGELAAQMRSGVWQIAA